MILFVLIVRVRLRFVIPAKFENGIGLAFRRKREVLAGTFEKSRI